ncbi:MAG: nitroreductase [Gemmobacter sp.]|nr:nitroreductase [Gemmobacter sp.]
MMSLEDAVRNRRSVRGYLPHEVPQDRIEAILTLAQAAPSNCNIQPWLSHVVSGPALRDLGARLVGAAQDGVRPNPDSKADRTFTGIWRERQIDAAVQLYGAMGIDRHDRPRRDWAYRRNLEFFGAPHAVFIFTPTEFGEREAVDLGIYAQTLMLALTAHNLASCAQGALGLYPDIIRDHLGIAPDNKLIFGISFGYEDPATAANRARVGRAPLAASVTFHR